jgi:hypothetical protein
MIVSCPSCGTRYRHYFEKLQAAAARCSCCEEMVPLIAARKPYVLIPSASVGGPASSIGMDDPSLAEHLAPSAQHGEPRSVTDALTYRMAAAEAASQEVEKIHAVRFGNANGAAPAVFRKRSAPTRRVRLTVAGPSKRTRSGKQELLIATILSLIGGTTAYYSAVEQGLNPITWVVAGGSLGLFMAWVCIRWTRRH